MTLMAAMYVPPSAHAQILERMLMPGPLVQGHAEFEKDCSACHTSFSKENQTGLCLDCHEDVAKDVDAKTGFHGRNPRISGRECVNCHTEHDGRNGIISPVTNSSFRHEFTDFPLEGAHLSTACDECHVSDKPRREALHECVDCHRTRDAHDGRLGEDCAQCHGPEDWQQSLFDHGVDTDFRLEGGHAQVSCVGCHGAETHEDTPSECVSCHLRDDTHAGVNGRECQRCHATEEWKTVKFDHTRDGHWELLGKHADVSCNFCHTVSLTNPDLKNSECVTCHRSDDAHQGKNGEICQDCHGNASWKESKFDHTVSTEFPLRGTHEQLQCVACHRGSMNEELPVTCFGCHQNSDVHQGSEGERCESCHNDQGWLGGIRFDHDLSSFPLIGYHAVVPCEACHLDKRFNDTAAGCMDCHSRSDVHRGSLGDQCGTCHNPNGWGFWTFDHTTQTDFVLADAHEGLACVMCHSAEGNGAWETSSDCGSCHRKNDKHDGRFGKNCSQCHNSISFSEVRRMQ